LSVDPDGLRGEEEDGGLVQLTYSSQVTFMQDARRYVANLTCPYAAVAGTSQPTQLPCPTASRSHLLPKMGFARSDETMHILSTSLAENWVYLPENS